MSNQEVVEEVLRGYRLPKPDSAPSIVYDIMLSCWKVDPSERPSFRDLLIQLKSAKDQLQQQSLLQPSSPSLSLVANSNDQTNNNDNNNNSRSSPVANTNSNTLEDNIDNNNNNEGRDESLPPSHNTSASAGGYVLTAPASTAISPSTSELLNIESDGHSNSNSNSNSSIEDFSQLTIQMPPPKDILSEEEKRKQKQNQLKKDKGDVAIPLQSTIVSIQ